MRSSLSGIKSINPLAHPKVVSRLRAHVERILEGTGIEINGDNPWDLQVHDDRFYGRVLLKGTLGLGEAYMDGWWDCERIDEFVHRATRKGLNREIGTLHRALLEAQAAAYNFQKKSRAFEVGRRHYDIGNELYRRMLDKRMIYSCGYWADAKTLDEAQEAKLDLVCRKLDLQPGMRVLDIGCGWGGALQYAAETYGVEGVGITVSEQQVEIAREKCSGLPVEIRLQDYRDVNEQFDRIFSIGMFEHVGYKNYETYFKTVRHCLKEDGLFLLHTIGSRRSSRRTDPFTERYIFPNSLAPSAQQITDTMEGVFVLEDWHSFGAYYDPTLMQWYRNFEATWDEIKHLYDERFYRMWRYYLLSCAGGFRSRQNQLWQLVLSPNGVLGGYDALARRRGVARAANGQEVVQQREHAA